MTISSFFFQQGYERQIKHLRRAHKENMQLNPQANKLYEDDAAMDQGHLSEPYHSPSNKIITKKAKPNTPQQSKAPFNITQSSVVESPVSRDERNSANTAELVECVTATDKLTRLARKRSLFGGEYSSSTSFEDICSLTEECSISSVSDLTHSEGKSVCIVCETCDTVIPFPVYVKGLTGNINWLKTKELACFHQVKSKTLNDLYICHKDKKDFITTMTTI